MLPASVLKEIFLNAFGIIPNARLCSRVLLLLYVNVLFIDILKYITQPYIKQHFHFARPFSMLLEDY